MKYGVALLGIFAVASLLGCDLIFEERRLKGQTESDLEMTFVDPPKLLENESFGWAEEGGDRALLKIASQDCIKLGEILSDRELIDATSDYFRMFQAEELTPSNIRSKYWKNQHGDSKHYVLETESCVLYREAFFE